MLSSCWLPFKNLPGRADYNATQRNVVIADRIGEKDTYWVVSEPIQFSTRVTNGACLPFPNADSAAWKSPAIGSDLPAAEQHVLLFQDGVILPDVFHLPGLSSVSSTFLRWLTQDGKEGPLVQMFSDQRFLLLPPVVYPKPMVFTGIEEPEDEPVDEDDLCLALKSISKAIKRARRLEEEQRIDKITVHDAKDIVYHFLAYAGIREFDALVDKWVATEFREVLKRIKGNN